jgi:hypothetical protein
VSCRQVRPGPSSDSGSGACQADSKPLRQSPPTPRTNIRLYLVARHAEGCETARRRGGKPPSGPPRCGAVPALGTRRPSASWGYPNDSGLIARSSLLAGWQSRDGPCSSERAATCRASETRGRREQPASRPPLPSPRQRTGRPSGGEVVPSSVPESIALNAMPTRTAGVAMAAAAAAAANRAAYTRRIRPDIVSPRSSRLKVMPAWTMAGAPTKAAVVAASNPAHISRARVNLSAPFAAAMCRRRYFGTPAGRGWTDGHRV